MAARKYSNVVNDPENRGLNQPLVNLTVNPGFRFDNLHTKRGTEGRQTHKDMLKNSEKVNICGSAICMSKLAVAVNYSM
jgi:hypothetical protein